MSWVILTGRQSDLDQFATPHKIITNRDYLAHPALFLAVSRIMTMGKVVAATGMILLTLEDQLAIQQSAQSRERRARKELEAYTKVVLSRRRVEDLKHSARRSSPTCTRTISSTIRR